MNGFPYLESDLERAQSLIKKAKWQFAKSMAFIPHWYTLRKNWKSQEDFEWLVMFIRKHGYIEHFYKKTYQYFDVNEYKYWSMGWPVEQTILINRAKRNNTQIEL
jgi:hypothetical protein